MNRKSKEFIALQAEWYDKLKKDGFEDLEWFNPKTGIGQGSHYLRSSNNFTMGELRRKYSSNLHQHYRLCQNFFSHGPFYPNLKHKYDTNDELSSIYPNFGAYAAALVKKSTYYNKAESKLWQMYCEGATVRQISAELRRLYRAGKLPKPAKSRLRAGQPYSTYWVHDRIHMLRVASIEFNKNHPEGITDSGDIADSEISALGFVRFDGSVGLPYDCEADEDFEGSDEEGAN